MIRKVLKAFVAAAMLCASLTGCSAVRRGIVYTVYPIGYLIERIGGVDVDSKTIHADETTMIQRAQIREDYQTILSNSAVFFHIGDLEPYLSVFSKEISASGINRIDLSTLNAIYNFKRYTQVNTNGEVTYVESPYYQGDEFNTIDTNSLDLCLWVDPIAMISMAKNIHSWLVKNYPEEQTMFDENLEKLERDLIDLDAQYQAMASSLIANNQTIKFVSMTASFGNWQKTYGIQTYPVILSKYGVLPNEAQLKKIKKTILNDNVKYIVYEPNMSEEMIELFNQLEEELDLTRVELSNLSSLTEAEINDGKDYLSLMYENLSVLETMRTSINAGNGE